MPTKGEALLTPYRALDLTDERGWFCGKILGDLGAEVVKVEPPGGDPSRKLGPFYQDLPHPEKSLFWLAYNTSKRGITLNLQTPDGKDIFLRLVQKADWVIESFHPGYMDSLGLSYEILSQANPRVILISITPFGQKGPYRNFQASDITLMALGGLMYICGDFDRPPVRISFPQAFLQASAAAAAGAMMALMARQKTGRGQFVDVSAQQTVISAMYNIRPFWDLNQAIMRRAGPYRVGLTADALQQQTWPCKDGFVTFVLLGGQGGVRNNRGLIEWMKEEGWNDDLLETMDWEHWDMVGATQEEIDRLSAPIGKFFLNHTKSELYEGARKRQLMLYPVLTIEDIRQSPQLASRNFWRSLDHPELGGPMTYPGAIAQGSEISCEPRFRAPRIGEHNSEIYAELGFKEENLVIMKEAGII